MTKRKGILTLVLTAVFIAVCAFVVFVGIGKTKTGSMENIILGLDLAGGVSITYETVDENPSAEDMADTVYKLQMRADSYSTESEVYQEGSNRISIEIPGVSDANEVLEELGNPGTLQFVTTTGDVVLTGTDVENAEAGTYTDQTTGATMYIVALTLTDAGREAFAEATADNIGKQIAIIYDDTVVSSPTVQDTISDGNAQITGMSSFEEADELASMIRIGALNLELNEIRSTVVGAKLGSQAISSSLIAGAIGLAIVCVLMMIVYLVPGIVASLSLIIYTLLILLVLNAFDITMSLSGIAGIVLSIGMAVDANVIIYARIREEIAAGRPVKSAVKIGFQKALSAIVDGNVTTLIAAAILMWRGTGMVRGFAQTLAIGIVLSMFTALVVTRLIMYALVALGMTKESYYGRAKTRKTIPFLEKKAVCFLIPIVIFVIGIASMAIQHFNGNQIFNYSLEFVGGTSTTVTFNEDMSIEELDAQVAPVIEEVTGDSNIQMQKIADSTQVVIKTRELSLEERSAMNSALEDNFDVDTEEITAESISSTVSNEMKWNAIVSVIIAGICMLIYIWFRFSDVRFAASAVLALLHDALIVLAFYAVFRVSVGSTFIACILTIVGYSINATIVIFDRIRENLKNEGSKADLKELVNRSITQTLTRSIYTSLTTFIMIVVLFILGVSSIREFAAPLMVGIVAGAYSSVCLTGAIWFILRKRLSKKTSD